MCFFNAVTILVKGHKKSVCLYSELTIVRFTFFVQVTLMTGLIYQIVHGKESSHRLKYRFSPWLLGVGTTKSGFWNGPPKFIPDGISSVWKPSMIRFWIRRTKFRRASPASGAGVASR